MFHYGGFWRRVLAYFLDIVPITCCVAVVFYLFFGFDTSLRQYLARGPRDLEARRAFLVDRNQIRDVSMALYLLYGGIMDASALRGSIGKRLVGLVVVNADGSRLTYAPAAKRNGAKSLSFLICGLGCLWIAWSKTKQGWHDSLAKAYVVSRSDVA